MEEIKKFRFREFPVYKDARSFNKELREFSQEHFPAEERFVLLPQLWRALDSILLNIAEGTDRGTDRDFARFLNNAHTSINEVVSCLDIALDCAYIAQQSHNYFLVKAGALANQLTAFRKNLLRYPTR